MTANDFNELVKKGPCQIKMNAGDIYTIEGSEFAVADIQTAAILAIDVEGNRRLRLITLRNISEARLTKR